MKRVLRMSVEVIDRKSELTIINVYLADNQVWVPVAT